MIKTLQKKFVFTAMIAVTVLLTVLLGGINIFNAQMNARQSNRLLRAIITEEIGPILSENSSDKNYGDRYFGAPEEAVRSAAYFIVYMDSAGKVIGADVSNIRSMTKENAQEIAEKIAEGSVSGKVGSYRYSAVQSFTGYGKAYVFLDTYAQSRNITTVLGLSAAVGAVCWVLMLLLVMALSKKAIKPIAENMEKQKRFVTDAGHEIKTPLAIILANTEAMELHTGESKWSSNIKNQVKRLDALTKNMLTLAKIDEGRVNIPEERFDVSLCLYNNIQMFTEPAKLKEISLEYDIQPEIFVLANGEYIERIFSVLLDNAVKYAPQCGEITASLTGTDKGFEMRIANTYNEKDTDTEKLFDRFYRQNSARTQSSGGYGIGLSAARAIAELYGGSIKAEVRDGKIEFTVKI